MVPSAVANKKRHETLQKFMLVNDSATIAVEIPVYLANDDIACGISFPQNYSFDIPLKKPGAFVFAQLPDDAGGGFSSDWIAAIVF